MEQVSRRIFLNSAWVAANLSAIAAAQQHAHEASLPLVPPRFEFFTADQAKDVDAMAELIIPADKTGGAHEAHVVYFIDRALMTFEADKKHRYNKTLEQLRAKYGKFFWQLSAAEQAAALSVLEKDPFFEILRTHTVMGYFTHPQYGGNFNLAGWKTIGFEDKFFFTPPFGYYDAEK